MKIRDILASFVNGFQSASSSVIESLGRLQEPMMVLYLLSGGLSIFLLLDLPFHPPVSTFWSCVFPLASLTMSIGSIYLDIHWLDYSKKRRAYVLYPALFVSYAASSTIGSFFVVYGLFSGRLTFFSALLLVASAFFWFIIYKLLQQACSNLKQEIFELGEEDERDIYEPLNEEPTLHPHVVGEASTTHLPDLTKSETGRSNIDDLENIGGENIPNVVQHLPLVEPNCLLV
eukprot:snap_masked-scaffold_11-processed-gene-6.30-mRNA-1 protein AED:1.00 eAED:1.00 QI:0/0/0/0/1/1/2/0/230